MPAPRARLNQQEAQFRHLVAALHQEHRADRRTIDLGDPAALARGIEVAQKLRDDPGDQRLEGRAPAILLGIARGVARQHPAHVADPVRAQHDRRRGRARRKRPLDRAHGLDQLLLARLRHRFQQRRDQPMRAAVERPKRGTAFGAERHEELPAVLGRGLAGDQAGLGERAEDAAQIAVVEPERAGDRARRRVRGLCKFVQHARLGQGEASVDETVPQQADLAGVEAVELAHRGDAGRKFGRSHRGYVKLYDISHTIHCLSQVSRRNLARGQRLSSSSNGMIPLRSRTRRPPPSRRKRSASGSPALSRWPPARS
jgi:hypothetical protein